MFVIGAALIGVLTFTVWTITSDDRHHRESSKIMADQQHHLQLNIPYTAPKRTLAKRQTLGKPKLPEKHKTKDVEETKEQKSEMPNKQSNKKLLDDEAVMRYCPTGWHADKGQCKRNSFSPNPVDTELMSLSGATPYRYACGAYVDDPQNLERDSTFLYTYHNNRKLMRDIAVSKQSPVISAFMESCERDAEATNGKPEHSKIVVLLMSYIEKMQSMDQLPETMGVLHRYDTTLPIELSFELDLLDGTRLIPLIRQSGIFANSITELKDKKHSMQVAKRFLGTLTTSYAEAVKMARDVINVELTLASAQHHTNANTILDYIDEYQNRDRLDRWHHDLGEAMLRQGNFNLSSFLISTIEPSAALTEIQFLNDLRIRPMWIYSRTYMERFAQLHRTHSLDTWKNYLRHAVLFNLVNDDSPHIDPEMHYSYHRNYESRYALPWKRPRKFLTISSNVSEVGGKPSKKDAFSVRMHDSALEQCSFISEAYLPVIMDDFFLHTRLNKNLRTRARQVVQTIQREFLDALKDDRPNTLFSYFNKEARQTAIEKIQAMHIVIGAPDHWEERDERNKALSQRVNAKSSFTDNMLAIRHFHMQEQALLYHQHVRSNQAIDRDRLFDGMVSTVNAFYQHQLNSIMISAGLLQPPIFSEHYDLEAWYARLGVFVGHEISHALDNIGTQFAANGTVHTWVTEEERKAYDARNRRLIDLYDTFTEGGNRHNGMKTLNENIADQTGFPLALAAAIHAKHDLDLEEFFLSYAQLYCEAISDEHEKHLIRTQSHSVGSMRVNKVLQAQPVFRAWWKKIHQFSKQKTAEQTKR